MFSIYLTITLFVIFCLFLHDDTAALQSAFAFSAPVTYSVISDYSDEPVSLPLAVEPNEPQAFVAESNPTPAPDTLIATVEPEDAVIELANHLASTMTKKALISLIQTNGWYEPGLTKLNKRQLAEVAAQRQALAAK